MKKLISVLSLCFAFLMIAAIPAGAYSSYQTYTYDIDGKPLWSPDAYTPLDQLVDSSIMGLSKPLSAVNDMVIDDNKNVYLADTGNSRIVVLDQFFKLKFTLSSFSNNGIPDSLSEPKGVFPTEERIYVCDTGNSRIVVFDMEGNFLFVIGAPQSNLFSSTDLYTPIAMAVSSTTNGDKLFIVSADTTKGIIVMKDTGEFESFIGAQKVDISLWTWIWRKLQTDEQRSSSEDIISDPYVNIAMSDNDMLYAISSVASNNIESVISSKSKSGDYAPVKLLNQKGDEIMRRNGFWPPVGEIDYQAVVADVEYEIVDIEEVIGTPSVLVDVAAGPQKTWSTVDQERSRIYTYDYDGNLLFAFGDKGFQTGNMQRIVAIAYQDEETLLVFDGETNKITIFKITDYGRILMQALRHQNEYKYDLAVSDWREILKRNTNFDAAYIGIGTALSRQGKYEEAIEYYKSAYDTDNYSSAYTIVRKNFIEDWILLVVVIAVGFIILLVKFFSYAGKVNKAATTAGGKRTFKEELLFGTHLIFHPFDGFWDLKYEKRGSVRASIVFIAATILAFFFQSLAQGYLFNTRGEYSTIWEQAISVLLPLFLFVIANWCVTTLFDGEGSFKDIFKTVSYSLVPVPFIIVITTIASNWVTANEMDIITLISTISFIWMGMLIVFGVMTTHRYSLGKNIITLIATLIGMVFIMFIGVLFSTLLGKVVGFISNLIVEINYRI